MQFVIAQIEGCDTRMPPLRSSCEEAAFTQMEDADWGIGALLQLGAEQPGSLALPARELPTPSTKQWAFIQNGKKNRSSSLSSCEFKSTAPAGSAARF